MGIYYIIDEASSSTTPPATCRSPKLLSLKFPLPSIRNNYSSATKKTTDRDDNGSLTAAATPPVHSSAASVPFLWEEVPGRPKPRSVAVLDFSFSSPHEQSRDDDEPGSTLLQLQLPPCRLIKSRDQRSIPSLNSPTTVLDGPNDDDHNYQDDDDDDDDDDVVSRSASLSFGNRTSSFRSSSSPSLTSNRWWGSFSLRRTTGNNIITSKDDHDQAGNINHVMRCRRSSSSFLSLSPPTRLLPLHFWTSISKSLKKVGVVSNRHKQSKRGVAFKAQTKRDAIATICTY